MTLGPRSMVRCTNAAVWIAKENSPGGDGLRGSMSLCDACKQILIKKLGRKFCTFKKIKKG